MRFKLIFSACGAALLTLASPAMPASAGTLEVNPVRLEINAAHRTATVTLRNPTDRPVTIRAYPLEWRQADGDEHYSESSAVIVSPPIFTIAPGATQLVRVGLRSPSRAPQAYRLIVEEVPDATPGNGIQVALRLNLPLFSGLSAGEVAAVRWSAWRGADGDWTLEAVNGGTGYVRLSHDEASAATGLRIGNSVNLGTVLAGATRRWRIGSSLDILDQARFQRIARTQDHVGAQASLD
jgi:fimbrial chaperone protein